MKVPYDIVRVEWVDSAHTSGWMPAKEVIADPQRTEDCVTVGFLLDKTDAEVVLVQSFSDGGSVDAVMGIPTSTVSRIVTLRRGADSHLI